MLDKSKKSYQKIIQLLVEARQSKGMTQTELGEKLGKRQTFISKYELGERRLDIVEFVIICEAIGVSVTKLIKQVK